MKEHDVEQTYVKAVSKKQHIKDIFYYTHIRN